MSNEVFYTWRQFDGDIKKITDQIKSSGKKFDGVWGPTRGGLVPAVMLSHALALPFLDRPTRKTLIVDDIADTGKTLKPFDPAFAKLRRAGGLRARNFIVTLFYHRQSIVVPDIWLREKKDDWIVFPWERA